MPEKPRKTYEISQEVMFYDTDCGGVVHNLAYMRMIELCRTKLGATMGMDFKSMGEQQVFTVVVRHEIDYIKPAVLGDTIKVIGWLSELERASFWCDFELRREFDDALLVKAHQKLALVQMPQGRPKRLPPEWFE